MIRYFLLVGVFALSACTSGGQTTKISPADVVEVVQKTESTYPGVRTSDAIVALLKISQKRGRSIDVLGWTQEHRSEGTQDVWFKVKIDDAPSEFHWVVTPDGMITPANKLAQNVTKKQMAAAR